MDAKGNLYGDTEFGGPSGCRRDFLKMIAYRPVTLSPSGQQGLIVRADLFCGSRGCQVYVLKQGESGYQVVLNEVGSLHSVTVANTTTNGFGLACFGELGRLRAYSPALADSAAVILVRDTGAGRRVSMALFIIRAVAWFISSLWRLSDAIHCRARCGWVRGWPLASSQGLFA